MEDQFKLWLTPPILMGLIFVAFRLKLPLDWSWCFILQALLMIAAGTLGFFFKPDWFWALMAWTFFVLFLVVPKLLITRCERSVGVLNYQATLSTTKMLRYFYWGKMGKFWQDLYQASAFYVLGKVKEGDALIEKWTSQKLPRLVREQLDSSRIGAFCLLGRWQAIVDDYDKNRAINATIPSSFNVQIGRAYAELGDLEKSAQFLEAAKLPESRMTAKNVAMSLLPFFALAGAQDYTEKLAAVLADEKEGLPDYLLNYWRARCLVVQGRTTEARKIYEEVLTRVEQLATTGRANAEAWRPRIERQIKAISAIEANEHEQHSEDVLNSGDHAPDSRGHILDSRGHVIDGHLLDGHLLDGDALEAQVDKQALADRVWQIFEQSGYVQEVVLPRRASPVVAVLVATICIAYFCSGAIDIAIYIRDFLNLSPITGSLVHSPIAAQIQQWCADQGSFCLDTFALDKEHVFQGQYWRLVTYMFLHGSITHLLLNVLGLYWFGRIAVNIYGPIKFLLLFLLTGILGGMTQMFYSPSVAIGASGGVLGIFGADAIGIFKLGDALPAKIRRHELTWMSVIAGSQVVIDQVIPQLTSIHIAGNAHLGGLVAGLVLGFLMPLRKPSYKRSPTDPARSARGV
jgi:membrane associated rhomboid family serine protease